MDFCGLLRVFESSQEVRKSEVIRLLGNKANPHYRKKKNIFFCGQVTSCPAVSITSPARGYMYIF